MTNIVVGNTIFLSSFEHSKGVGAHGIYTNRLLTRACFGTTHFKILKKVYFYLMYDALSIVDILFLSHQHTPVKLIGAIYLYSE